MKKGKPGRILNFGVVSAAIGCALGGLDYFLFELTGPEPGIIEKFFSSPGFPGVSSFAAQLILFSILGMTIAFLSRFLLFIISNFLKTNENFFSILFTSLAIAFFVIALRVITNQKSFFPLILFFLFSTTISLFFSFHMLHRSRIAGVPNTSGPSAVFLVAVLGLAVLLPGMHSVVLGITQQGPAEGPDSPNVLFIVLDTLRADHLGCYGAEPDASPNLDWVARNGRVFENAYSAAPWTLPSHASIFTGLYPSQHRAEYGHLSLHEDYLTIAEHLGEHGYRTAGFSENPFVSWSYGLTQGFGEFHDSWRRPLVLRGLLEVATMTFGLKDRREYTGRTLGLLEGWIGKQQKSSQPFFAFVNLMAPHLPHYPRPGFPDNPTISAALERIEPVNLVPERYYLPAHHLDEEDLRVMRDLYRQDIRFLDQQIGLLFASLREQKTFENTIVVITSDHGESFGEHGFIEHQFSLYDTLIHVPLIIFYPQLLNAEIVSKTVSQTEIFDTIIELTSTPFPVDRPPESRRSLAGKIDPAPAYAEAGNGVEMLMSVLSAETNDFDYQPFDRALKCIIDGGSKLIWDSNGATELYDLATDSRETRDRAGQDPDRARVLTQQLALWQESVRRNRAPDGVPEIDPAAIEALTALGYVQ